jgi:hypothetical protein
LARLTILIGGSCRLFLAGVKVSPATDKKVRTGNPLHYGSYLKGAFMDITTINRTVHPAGG